MDNNQKKPLFMNPSEPIIGLSINDLNKYLPAVKKVDDLTMTNHNMRDGLFLGLALEGLRRIPNNSIDLIITEPPKKPIQKIKNNNPLTIQEHFEWNNNWLKESVRILKPTGGIYLICGWRFSGMYHSLLSNYFKIQTRITWEDNNIKDQPSPATWNNNVSDIWFATKSMEFMFNQRVATQNVDKSTHENRINNNFWDDIIDFKPDDKVKMNDDKPEKLIERILMASSFKLNWVLDPFTNSGGIGLVSKKMGRRFIGFETDKDKLLMAMKRIDG